MTLRATWLLLILLGLGNVAQAQALWQNTTVGMNLADVQKHYPAAVPPVSSPGLLGTGATEKLRLEGVEVARHRFHAQFFFKDDRLTQVTLELDDPPGFSGAEILFTSLVDQLRTKYGAEFSLHRNRGVMPTILASWHGETNINLICIGVVDHPATLNVIYRAMSEEKENNL